MDDLISKLSEIRSDYNCFNAGEEPQYRALSEAIKILSQRADGDTISRQAAIDTIMGQPPEPHYPSWYAAQIEKLPAAQPATNCSEIPNGSDDTISRQAAIDALKDWYDGMIISSFRGIEKVIKALPSAQSEKEIAKRVLWTGWKGCRNTRYKCPNCKKPVKNDDIYCHRCGQKLMFPHISFTDYVPGEKQETIVRWDDE